MTSYLFDDLKPSDEPIVRDWLQRYLHEHLQWWSEALGTPWSSEQIKQHIATHDLEERDWNELFLARQNKNTLVAVARNNDDLCGIVLAELGRDRYMKVPTGSIGWIYIDEKHRGQKLGQRLLRIAHDWMHDKGVIMREVHVTAANPSAVGLYKASGYKVIDHRMLG
ncbi:MAG: GNAT family N-acetyltransferase [Deltaproteobacteria bacterium]|nr:MAG: GNAT family N-acetyltransferase [Deltaproteobacteria bacterium]